MFDFITNPEERGQVGIGTLIVFIAMVLVAAIAAGVLINTAGFLQTQAEATGQESTDLVSERIDVTSEVGIVGSESNGELSEIRLSVSGAPGADQIDLSETTIQVVGPGGQENLVFTDEAPTGNQLTQVSVSDVSASATQFDVTIETANIDNDDNPVNVAVDRNGDTGNADTSGGTGTQTISVTTDASGGDINLDAAAFSGGDTIELTISNADMSNDLTATETVDDSSDTEITTPETDQQISNLNANQFAVGSDGSFESSPVLDDQKDYTILINPDAGALENDDDSPFGEGQSATLDIVSPAGATTSVELRAPDLFNTNGEAVRL